MSLGAQTLGGFAISSEEYSTRDVVDITASEGPESVLDAVELPLLIFVEYETFNNIFKPFPRPTRWVL